MESAKMIEAAAAAWFAKRDSSGWQEKDQVALEEWLGADVAHRVAYIRIEAAWRHAHRLKALEAGMQPATVRTSGEWQVPLPSSRLAYRPSGRFRVGTWAAVGAAAVLVFAVVVARWTLLFSSVPVYRTSIGGLETVPLEDGSLATLNTDSEIRVIFTKDARIVVLQQGEAFFEVAKDPGRPFIVEVGTRRVIAVGTKFSVRREDEIVRVAVTEGHVRLEGGNALGKLPAHLKPGDVASADEDNTLVQEKPVPLLETEYLSWRTGYLVFQETALSDAVNEFNRYHFKKIRVADAEVGAIRIGGNFRVSNVDAFLRLLEQGFPIHAVKDADEIVLKHN